MDNTEQPGKAVKTYPPPPPLTDEDFLLGKKTLRNFDIIFAIAAVACIGIAVFTMVQVPWETRYPVPTRRGHYTPMQIAFFMPLLVLVMFRGRRKPDDHHMRRGSRIAVLVFAVALSLLLVWGQWHMAYQIFESVASK